MLQSLRMSEAKELRSPLLAPLKAILALGVAAFFFVFGYTIGHTNDDGSGAVIGKYQNPPVVSGADVDFDLFWDVWRLVEQQYVDQPVVDKDLFYGSLQGLLWGLGDPYSTFFTPEMAASFAQELEGSFFGIGAEIGLDDDGFVVVIAPLPETPADNAGLKPGDHIIMIDKVDTTGMSVNEAVDLIRGDKGTHVVLTIFREGLEEPFDVDIIRDEINVDSVISEIRDDGVVVITITMFNEDTVRLFDKAVKEVLNRGAKKLVLDLRNNPGGYLDAAINLAGYWIDNRTAVIEEVRGEQQAFLAQGDSRLAGLDTVVLVNGGSASASEILSGALQDYKLAHLIGEQTFGKGSVQEYHELPDGSAVKITVARWLTPLGRSIDELGITPDEIVAPSENAEEDSQFDAALRFLEASE